MFDVIPVPDRYVVRPLPSRDRSAEAPPKQRVEAPFLLRSHLHAIRGGVEGWDLEIECVEALTDTEFEKLAKELRKGVKEQGLLNAIEKWAAEVRASRAPAMSIAAAA